MSNKVNFKKKEADFPTSNIDNDTLYFKTDTNCMQMKLGNMPLRNDVIDLVFTHNENSTESHCILEATSDYITNLHDGLKIIIRDISDSSTVGYRFGSTVTEIRINNSIDNLIYDISGTTRLTASEIEPGYNTSSGNEPIYTTDNKYAIMLQFVKNLNTSPNIDGWIIIGQYNVLSINGGEMNGDIEMNDNKITGLHVSENSDDAITRGETLVLENNMFVAGIDSGAHSRNDRIIRGVATPTNDNDAANKGYVNSQISTAIENIDINPTLRNDTSVSYFDGTKDYNFLYLAPSTSGYNTIGIESGKQMLTGHMCHIFLYNAGGNSVVATYNMSGNRVIRIPCDFCVGGQASGSNSNYVWINNQFVHGDGIGNNSYKFYKVGSSSSRSNMNEISIFFSAYPINNSTQYRTIIKIDAEETTDPSGPTE